MVLLQCEECWEQRCDRRRTPFGILPKLSLAWDAAFSVLYIAHQKGKYNHIGACFGQTQPQLRNETSLITVRLLQLLCCRDPSAPS